MCSDVGAEPIGAQNTINQHLGDYSVSVVLLSVVGSDTFLGLPSAALLALPRSANVGAAAFNSISLASFAGVLLQLPVNNDRRRLHAAHKRGVGKAAGMR